MPTTSDPLPAQRSALCVALLCGLLLVGCDPAKSPPSGSAGPASSSHTLATLPVTLDGVFIVSVEKGDVDENDVSEVNFGTLTVAGVDHLVQVSGAVLRASGLPRTGGKVRATLGSRTDLYGPPTYIVTAMERL
jgi:hypothetical protein